MAASVMDAQLQPLQPTVTHDHLEESLVKVEAPKALSLKDALALKPPMHLEPFKSQPTTGVGAGCFAGLERLSAWTRQQLKALKASFENRSQSDKPIDSKQTGLKMKRLPTPSAAELTVVLPYLAARAVCPTRNQIGHNRRRDSRGRCNSGSSGLSSNLCLAPKSHSGLPTSTPVPSLVGFPRRLNLSVPAEVPAAQCGSPFQQAIGHAELAAAIVTAAGQNSRRHLRPLARRVVPWATLCIGYSQWDNMGILLMLRCWMGFLILIFMAMSLTVFVNRLDA